MFDFFTDDVLRLVDALNRIGSFLTSIIWT